MIRASSAETVTFDRGRRARGRRSGADVGRLVERLVDFRSRPILVERRTEQFLLGHESKRAVRSVLDHVAQIDEIENAPDRRCLEVVVRPLQHGLLHQPAVAAVLGEKALRVLGEPFERVPVLVAFGGVHAATVAEAGHADHLPFDGSQRTSKELAAENAGHRLDGREDPLQHRRAVVAVGGCLVAAEEFGEPRQRRGVVDGGREIENASDVHVAVWLALERERIALRH